MSKCRVVYGPDKSVAVIHPAPQSKRPKETEEEWLERVFTKAMQPQYNKEGQQVNPLYGLPYDDIDKSQLPQSREDRDAWEGEKGKGISINVVKAEQIRKAIEREEKIRDKIREMAIKELEKEEEP